MIAFAGMLVEPAREAGMKTPEVEDSEDFDPEEFPHFAVFCNAQLGAPMPDYSAHRHNAEVVAKIPDSKIRKVTGKDLLKAGFRVGYSKP